MLHVLCSPHAHKTNAQGPGIAIVGFDPIGGGAPAVIRLRARDSVVRRGCLADMSSLLTFVMLVTSVDVSRRGDLTEATLEGKLWKPWGIDIPSSWQGESFVKWSEEG